jgi:hypothetical protein
VKWDKISNSKTEKQTLTLIYEIIVWVRGNVSGQRLERYVVLDESFILGEAAENEPPCLTCRACIVELALSRSPCHSRLVVLGLSFSACHAHLAASSRSPANTFIFS